MSRTMDRRLLLSLPTAAIAWTITGCTTPPPVTPRFAEIGFRNQPQYRFRVSSAEAANVFQQTMAPPFVEHRAPVPPAEAAARWLRDRVVASGGEHTLRLVVKEASIRETALERTQGVRGLFTTDQSHRYDAVLDVDLEIRNARGLRDGVVTSRSERSRTVAETISLAGRERVWFEMVEAMGQDMNSELDRGIRSTLVRFLVL